MDFRKDMIDVISERQHATARLARSKNKKFSAYPIRSAWPTDTASTGL
jgi:hypothetical protein